MIYPVDEAGWFSAPKVECWSDGEYYLMYLFKHVSTLKIITVNSRLGRESWKILKRSPISIGMHHLGLAQVFYENLSVT
jgi:hypothetical protein